MLNDLGAGSSRMHYLLRHKAPFSIISSSFYIFKGTPIMLSKIEHPSIEEIDTVHRQYVAALQEMYAVNALKYLTDSKGDRIAVPQPLVIS